MPLSIEDWRQRILKIFEVNGHSRSITKENVLSNFIHHTDINTEKAFSSLVTDELILKISLSDKTMYCLNIFDKSKEIYSEIMGKNTKLVIHADQPLDMEFDNLDYVFVTEADRAYPNRGKYYHCTKKTDKTFWITLMKPKGNSKAKRLVVGSLSQPNTRLYKIDKATKIEAKTSRNGYIIKKHVEDIEPKACGNTRQYSKAAFDILEYQKRIQAVASKGRTIKYQLVEERYAQKVVQLRLDDIFEDVSKPRIKTS